MLTAIRTGSGGVENGKIILQFLSDDQKKYDIALTRDAAIDALMVILQDAKSLPQSTQTTVSGVMFQGGAAFAVGDQMQPILVLLVGGLEIPIILTVSALTLLHGNISKFLSGPKH